MSHIRTNLSGAGEETWDDLDGKHVVRLCGDDSVLRIATDHAAGASLSPGLLLRVDLPDGTAVILESSLRVLTSIIDDIHEYYEGTWKDRHQVAML
jgi:hypothetical protein